MPALYDTGSKRKFKDLLSEDDASLAPMEVAEQLPPDMPNAQDTSPPDDSIAAQLAANQEAVSEASRQSDKLHANAGQQQLNAIYNPSDDIRELASRRALGNVVKLGARAMDSATKTAQGDTGNSKDLMAAQDNNSQAFADELKLSQGSQAQFQKSADDAERTANTPLANLAVRQKAQKEGVLSVLDAAKARREGAAEDELDRPLSPEERDGYNKIFAEKGMNIKFPEGMTRRQLENSPLGKAAIKAVESKAKAGADTGEWQPTKFQTIGNSVYAVTVSKTDPNKVTKQLLGAAPEKDKPPKQYRYLNKATGQFEVATPDENGVLGNQERDSGVKTPDGKSTYKLNPAQFRYLDDITTKFAVERRSIHMSKEGIRRSEALIKTDINQAYGLVAINIIRASGENRIHNSELDNFKTDPDVMAAAEAYKAGRVLGKLSETQKIKLGKLLHALKVATKANEKDYQKVVHQGASTLGIPKPVVDNAIGIKTANVIRQPDPDDKDMITAVKLYNADPEGNEKLGNILRAEGIIE
jgi:hypothetical protein